MKTDYRKIYEENFGKIPTDENGRSYQIHHIDGNRENNDISNLKCVSIQEHYDIHYAQQDWGACYLLGRKMKMSVKELSELARQQQLKLVENGTHNQLGGKYQKERVANGTHNFLKENNKAEPWNKGKTKDTDPRVAKNAESRSKVKYSEETLQKFRKPKTEEHKKNMSLGQRGKKYPKKPCEICGQEIPTNAMSSHMRTHSEK